MPAVGPALDAIADLVGRTDPSDDDAVTDALFAVSSAMVDAVVLGLDADPDPGEAGQATGPLLARGQGVSPGGAAGLGLDNGGGGSVREQVSAEVAGGACDVMQPSSQATFFAVADELARSEVVIMAVYADTAAPFPLEAVMLDGVSERTASLLSIDTNAIETIGERLSNQVVALRATAESFSSAG